MLHAATSPSARRSLNRLGLWLFLLSESFLFGAALSSRYYLHGVERPPEVNQLLGLAITGVLLVSSWTAYRAERAAAHGHQRGLLRNLAATVGLGFLFLVGVVGEWSEAFHFFPPHTPYGTIFFTTTGLHAFHVLTGVLALTIVLHLARDGRFTHGDYWGVEGVVKYWHFVDVAWVFIYPTLYLVR